MKFLSSVLLGATLAGFFATAASAIVISIDNIDYQIFQLPDDNTFADDEQSLISTPWWGDEAKARLVSAEYVSQANIGFPGVNFAVDYNNDFFDPGISYFNAYDLNPGGFALRLAPTGGGIPGPFIAAVAVPEINGSAFARLLLLFGAGWLALAALRGQSRSASLT